MDSIKKAMMKKKIKGAIDSRMTDSDKSHFESSSEAMSMVNKMESGRMTDKDRMSVYKKMKQRGY